MRLTSTAVLLVAGIVTSVGLVIAQTDDAQRRQAKPKSDAGQQPTEPKGQAQPRSAEPQRRPPEAEPSGRAQPRAEAPPERGQRPRPSPPPPPRTVPPRYYGLPRAYYFPVVSLQRGYYYHPYFGFYYGPYYGPFYPYPGPYIGQFPYSTSAIRTRVRPVETQVHINGYFAGIVDDFDGVFQRLYLPAGQHEIELRLDGYRTYRQKLYAGPGDTLEITHQMQPLGPGELNDPVSSPRTLPREWTPPPVVDDRPASPFGILAIRVEPADAQMFVDDEAWVAMEGRDELVIHMEAGWHRLEIRKEGYQTFGTEVELSQGATTRLNVKLVR